MAGYPTDIFSSTHAMVILSVNKKQGTRLISAGNTLRLDVSSPIIWLKKTGVSEMQKFAFLTLIK
jgi:hypothetical protein